MSSSASSRTTVCRYAEAATAPARAAASGLAPCAEVAALSVPTVCPCKSISETSAKHGGAPLRVRRLHVGVKVGLSFFHFPTDCACIFMLNLNIQPPNTMTKHILQTFAILLIAIIGFTSCSPEEEGPCAEMTSLSNTFQAQSNEMQGSFTPWGAKSDLDNMKITWSRMMNHARHCRRCTRYIKKEYDSIGKLEAAAQQTFREIEAQLDRGSTEFIQNFFKGFLIGAGIL